MAPSAIARQSSATTSTSCTPSRAASRPWCIACAELREIEYAYVVFDHAYYDALAHIVPFLEANQIYPRGRYGSWTYNSMEDCLMLGRDIAQKLLAAAETSAT